MAFFNAVFRDYNPESGKSDILCRVWISSLSDLKSLPRSWFLRHEGDLVKKTEVNKRLLVKFTLVSPLHIYCRPKRRKEYPIQVNLEFFEGGSDEGRCKGISLKSITVDVEEEDTVEVLKWKIETGSGIPTSEQRLIYAGAQLRDRKTVKEYGIRMEEVVHVVDGVRRGHSSNDAVMEENKDNQPRGNEGPPDSSPEPEKEGGMTCVLCDRRRLGMEEFLVDCGHYYHGCCLQVLSQGKGCVICDAELLGWSEALELFSEEEYKLGEKEKKTTAQTQTAGINSGGASGAGAQERSRLLQSPTLLRNEDDDEDIDEGIEVDHSAEEAIQYSEAHYQQQGGILQKLKECDEFYFFIAAIVIPMLVGVTMGNFWGTLAALAMIELLRRRNLGNDDNPPREE